MMSAEVKNMELMEKKLSEKEVYKGRIVRLHVDEVELPNGKTGLREIIDHPGGVGILAMDDDGRVMMVQQYRYAFGKTLWEIPAGKREPGEEPLETAKRELLEEVGATAERWMPLGEIIPSPGCYGEKLYLFLARGLTFGEGHLDEDEFLTVSRLPMVELIQGCVSGEIQDAKTVIAALKAKYIMGM